MRILLSAYSCDPNKGSESGFGWNWAYHLALRGHEVHLLTRAINVPAIEQQLKKSPNPNLITHGVDIPSWCRPLIRGSVGVYLQYQFWQKAALEEVRRLIRDQDIDLIHHVTWGSLHGGSHLWKIGKPFIFGPIGGGQTTPVVLLKMFETERPKEILRTLTTKNLPLFFPNAKKTVRNSTVILATNYETLELLRDMKAKQACLFLDTGLPAEFIPLTRPIREPQEVLRLLWVGRIYARKGLNLVLSALQQVRIPFKLSILGGGPWESRIPVWIKEYGLAGKVDWLGQLPWAEVKRNYIENDVFIFTSLRESFGSQLLESMAYGLPVVTLNQFGARDFVPEDAGFKIPVTTLEHTKTLLAQAIERLWYERGLQDKMGAAGYAFAKSQTWEQKAIEMEKVSTTILQPK
jgi:glycosyltransferase involved in cell wall biosynthesis